MNLPEIKTFLQSESDKIERKNRIIEIIRMAIAKREIYARSEFYTTFGTPLEKAEDLERCDAVIARLLKYYQTESLKRTNP